MASKRAESPIIVIVGPTASGKTALAIEVAKDLGGEIICADSRTVYKGMDIGTAKPTKEEQLLVPHWGLDLAEPGEKFTVADFKSYAVEKISDIRSRDMVPIIVGGTGLYVDAVLFDYGFGDKSDDKARAILEEMSIESLQQYCIDNSIRLPENKQNKRHLVRAIERKDANIQRKLQPIAMSIIVGIATDREALRTRIASRAEQILTSGVVEEAIELGKKYGWENEAMTGNVYPIVKSYLEGDSDMQSTVSEFTTLDWRLAKRQLTWFRRNPYIIWTSQGEAKVYIEQALAT